MAQTQTKEPKTERTSEPLIDLREAMREQHKQASRQMWKRMDEYIIRIMAYGS